MINKRFNVFKNKENIQSNLGGKKFLNFKSTFSYKHILYNYNILFLCFLWCLLNKIMMC